MDPSDPTFTTGNKLSPTEKIGEKNTQEKAANIDELIKSLDRRQAEPQKQTLQLEFSGLPKDVSVKTTSPDNKIQLIPAMGVSR